MMFKSKLNLKLIGIILLTLMMITACSIQPIQEQEPTPEPVVTDDTDVADEELYQEVISEDTVVEEINIIMCNAFGWEQYPSKLKEHGLLEKYSITIIDSGYDAFVDYEDYLRVSLLSGNDSFDMYYMFSRYMDERSFVEEGYYVDLAQHDGLNNQFNLMFDPIKESMTFNEEIYGFPVFYYLPFCVTVNDNVGDFNITVNDTITYEDLLEWSSMDNEDINDVTIGRLIQNSIIYSSLNCLFDYTTYKMDLDNYPFEYMKNLYNEFTVEGLVDDSKGIQLVEGYINDTDLAFATFAAKPFNTNYLNTDIYTIRPLDFSNAVNIKSGYMQSFLIINPYSNNIDICYEVLNEYADTLKYTIQQTPNSNWDEIASYIYKDISTYDNIPEGLVKLEVNQYSLDTIGSIFNNSVPLQKNPTTDECVEYMKQYFNDKITLDEAKESMEEVAELVREEYLLD